MITNRGTGTRAGKSHGGTIKEEKGTGKTKDKATTGGINNKEGMTTTDQRNEATSREITDQGTPGTQEDFSSQEMEDFHWCAIDACRMDIWHGTVRTHHRRANQSRRSKSNLIKRGVKQVTTKNKEARVEEDAVRLQTQKRVEETNAKQAAEIQVKEEPAVDLSDLRGCEIKMTLEQLLWLVPRFREG